MNTAKTRIPALERAFAEHLLSLQDDSHRDNTYTRISSSGEAPCQIYNRRTGAHTVRNTAHQEYVFQVGHSYHDMWQRISHAMGLSWCQNEDGRWNGLAEVEVADHDMQVMGHFDLFTAPIGYHPKDGKLMVGRGSTHFLVDFKTMGNIPAIKVRNTGDRYPKTLRGITETMEIKGGTVTIEPGKWDGLKRMKDEHRLQASQYAHMIAKDGLPLDRWPPHWTHARIEGDRVFPKVGGVIIVYLAKDKAMRDYPDEFDPMNVPVKVYAERIRPDILGELHAKYRFLNTCVEPFREAVKGLDGSKSGEVRRNEARLEFEPERTPWPGGMAFPCAYCSFRHHCWPDEFDGTGRLLKIRRRRA